MTKTTHSGIPRLIAATRYSLQGLAAAWKHEEAFRIEVYLAAVFIPLSFVIGQDLNQQLLLLISCALVLMAELVNSAIEAIVDRISLDHHTLSGRSKDIGSAVVFIALVLFVVVWALSAWQYLSV